MSWLTKAIIEGLQACVVIRLRNAPALDTIEQVVDIWVAVFERQPIAWDENQDLWRIRDAFLAVLGDCETFPTPKKVLEYLPSRRAVEFRLPRPERTPMPQDCKVELEKILGKFGVKK